MIGKTIDLEPDRSDIDNEQTEEKAAGVHHTIPSLTRCKHYNAWDELTPKQVDMSAIILIYE